MDTATMRCRMKHLHSGISAAEKPCCIRRDRWRCRATSTWSTTGLLLLFCFKSTAEAAGLWGLGSGGATQRGDGRRSIDSNGGDMDEVFAKCQQEQVPLGTCKIPEH